MDTRGGENILQFIFTSVSCFAAGIVISKKSAGKGVLRMPLEFNVSLLTLVSPLYLLRCNSEKFFLLISPFEILQFVKIGLGPTDQILLKPNL